MSNLITLLKADFINNLGFNSFNIKKVNRKEKKKLLTKMILLFLIPIGILYMSGLYSYLISDMLKSMGSMELLIILGIISSSAAVFMTTIYKAQGNLFSSKDLNMLMALPIKNSIIFASKIIELLSLNCIFSACVIIPPSVIYFIYSDINAGVFFAILILSMFFIPLIPVLLGIIVSFIVAFIASKMKHKNLVTIIGSIIVFSIIFILSFKAQDLLNNIVGNSLNIIGGIEKLYPPAAYLTKALVEGNFIELGKFIFISIIPFILFVILFGTQFKKINSRLGESFKKESNYRVTSLETSSQLKALYKKELKSYLSIPVYVLNTAFGMILLLICSVAILFVSPETMSQLIGAPELANQMNLVILGVSIFCIGLSSTTPPSLSLEGKNFWIIKSLPIGAKNVFLSKILVCLTVTIPAIIVANILFSIGLKFTFTQLILNLLVTIIYGVLSSIVGIIINLYFLKLEWSNPVVVVKQSMSVFINMIFTFLTIGVGFLILFLVRSLNLISFLGIVIVLLIALLAISLLFLKRKGVDKFYSI